MPASHVDEAKRIACAEIVPECPFTASAATEEELLQKVVAHAAHVVTRFGSGIRDPGSGIRSNPDSQRRTTDPGQRIRTTDPGSRQNS